MDSTLGSAALGRFLDVGDLRRAGEWLVQNYATDVVSMCRAMVRERHLAEDLAQDSFSSAFASLSSFRREASPRTWLLAITRNRCIDHLRRLQRDPWGGADGDEPDAHADDAPLPADLVLRRDDVEAALGTLAEAERALVVLRFRHGLEYPELADVFGLREGTLRMRLSRALSRMRDVLEARDRAARSIPPAVPAASPVRPSPAAPAAPAPSPGIPPRPPAAYPPSRPALGASASHSRAVTSSATPRARLAWWTRLLSVFGLGRAESSPPEDDGPSPELQQRLDALVSALPGG